MKRAACVDTVATMQSVVSVEASYCTTSGENISERISRLIESVIALVGRTCSTSFGRHGNGRCPLRSRTSVA